MLLPYNSISLLIIRFCLRYEIGTRIHTLLHQSHPLTFLNNGLSSIDFRRVAFIKYNIIVDSFLYQYAITSNHSYLFIHEGFPLHSTSINMFQVLFPILSYLTSTCRHVDDSMSTPNLSGFIIQSSVGYSDSRMDSTESSNSFPSSKSERKPDMMNVLCLQVPLLFQFNLEPYNLVKGRNILSL